MRQAFSASSRACGWQRRDSSNLVFQRIREAAHAVMKFPGTVLKLDQAQTFLATIGIDDCGHEDFGSYFDSGAAHNYWSGLYRPAFDQRPSDRSTGELSGFGIALSWGAIAMLSVDQFLRLISVPAFFAAFMIASQISAALNPI